ncbi:MAG: hypothetical protein ABI847_15300, partial [Anaerolineales bacterium]
MKRITLPILMLLSLALACNFGAAGPTATPLPLPPTGAPGTALPPTAAPATDLPATVAPATDTPLPAEPSATPAAATGNLHVVVRLPDGTVQIVDTGLPAAGIRLNQGLLPAGGPAGAAAYVLNFTGGTTAQRVDADGATDLPFVTGANYGLAVWPASGDEPARLAWGTSPTGNAAVTQLFIAEPNPGGFDVRPVLTETIEPGALPYQLVAQRWSDDGQHLYFSREPYGIGGYIPFAGASSFYRFNLDASSVTAFAVFPASNGSMICLDDVNADFSLAAGHCADPNTITIVDLFGDHDRTITPPGTITDFRLVGSARFSPDG